MTTPHTAAETLAAARVLLSRMGISPADLVAHSTAPTFAEVIPQVRKTLSPGTARTYNAAFARLLRVLPDRRLDEVTQPELAALARQVHDTARTNRATRHGTSYAVEHFVSAVRCLYRYAEINGWIRPGDNPARRTPVPARQSSQRYAISAPRLAEICTVVATTGNDPELDSLLLRLHIETACRRGGALALRPADLDTEQCLVHLREKGGTDRWQPVSPTVMRHLVQHAEQRHSPRFDQLLRYRDGTPITGRRYDYIWSRVRGEIAWAAAQRVSMHWLRHTTLTWVERTFGYAVARRFAGHQHGRAAGTTGTYVKADIQEVAAALAVMTREPHPLADTQCPHTPPAGIPG
ncbi:site-specific integrase [Nocardia sp. NPDC050435]|uniref:tyrosine-type recombinase/integrase n=1 Tax=Nocardia sp. NPDC050435 TaxID=3155040 RepID=UPI0033E90E20